MIRSKYYIFIPIFAQSCINIYHLYYQAYDAIRITCNMAGFFPFISSRYLESRPDVDLIFEQRNRLNTIVCRLFLLGPEAKGLQLYPILRKYSSPSSTHHDPRISKCLLVVSLIGATAIYNYPVTQSSFRTIIQSSRQQFRG